MTRKAKMAFKREVLAIMLHAHNDVLHEYDWQAPGVRRTEGDAIELHRYKDKRFNKAATQVSDLASSESGDSLSSSNPPSSPSEYDTGRSNNV